MASLYIDAHQKGVKEAMADIETNEEGTPIPQPVKKTGDDGLPEAKEAGSHGKHDWQGMLQNGRKLQVCAWCGKERDAE